MILRALALGALVITVAACPAAASALRPLLKNFARFKRRSLEQALRKLRDRRLIEFIGKDGKLMLAITEGGRQRLRELDFDKIVIPIPERWNGIWSVILFDIPEKQRTARDALRRKMEYLGCFRLHKSVFVHPAPCEDEIDFVSELFQVTRYVTIFRTNSLGRHEYLAARHFNLSKA